MNLFHLIVMSLARAILLCLFGVVAFCMTNSLDMPRERKLPASAVIFFVACTIYNYVITDRGELCIG